MVEVELLTSLVYLFIHSSKVPKDKEILVLRRRFYCNI